MKVFFYIALFGFSFILIAIGITGIPHAEQSPLWSMSLNHSDNGTTYSTTYDKNKVTESFGVSIYPGPERQHESNQTALRRIDPDEPFEGYLWVNNQMTKDSDFLVFGLLDYQQIPFVFNNSGSGIHHTIHMAPFRESFFPFRLPPMTEGSHDFEIFLVMKPDMHSLNESFRLSTDQALLGSRRVNIIVGNASVFSAPSLNEYDGPAISCGSDYVLNDGLLVTAKPCDTRALLSANVTPDGLFDYSINVAADNHYPISIAIVPLLDYYQVPLAKNTNDRVAFLNLNSGEKSAIPANVVVPKDEGVHELMVLWIPRPYHSIDDDARSVAQYHQWPWSEPSIRVGLDVRSGFPAPDRATSGVYPPLVSAGNDTISISPVNNHTAGEIFAINGTTTLPTGKTLVIDIEAVRLHPAPSHEPPQNTTALTGQTTTEKYPDGITRWSFVVASASLIPDDYTIRVTSFEPPIIESSADFTLQSRNGTTPGICQTADETGHPPTPSSPQPAVPAPFPVIVTVTALCILGVYSRVFRK